MELAVIKCTPCCNLCGVCCDTVTRSLEKSAIDALFFAIQVADLMQRSKSGPLDDCAPF
jgi:hypothetical protein